MITNGRRDLTDIGRYRMHSDEMQIVSGPIHDPVIHFEAPPSATMQPEMERFLDWFQRTGPGGVETLPPLTRAGIAHLWFVSIHPFEDGNGRLARAIAEKALAQSLGQPSLLAMAATILLRRKYYYSALEAANKRNEITDWLAWFAAIALEAQARAIAGIDFLIDKTRLLDRLHGQLNERQQKVMLRMLAEGPEGFRGGLSAGNYIGITGASQATTTRDLVGLVSKDALVRTGERRHARYHLTIALRPVGAVTIDNDGRLSGI
jgi:Fic family protein